MKESFLTFKKASFSKLSILHLCYTLTCQLSAIFCLFHAAQTKRASKFHSNEKAIHKTKSETLAFSTGPYR